MEWHCGGYAAQTHAHTSIYDILHILKCPCKCTICTMPNAQPDTSQRQTQRAPPSHSFTHSVRPPDRHGAFVTCAYAIIAHNITNTISVVNTIYYAAMCPSSVFICTHKQRLSLAHPNDFSLSIKPSSLSLASLASSWTLLADDDRAVDRRNGCQLYIGWCY